MLLLLFKEKSCCFSHSAHWLPTRKKLLYTVANPARGLLNREKKKKKKSGSMYVCMYVCIFIKLHISAQSGLVILVILCHLR